MIKDTVYRIIGAFLIILSLLLFIIIKDPSRIASIALGIELGAGIGFLTSGESALWFWKAFIKK